MPIVNPSFEFSSNVSTPWEAAGWSYDSNAACRIKGFGTYEDPYEKFAWSPYTEDLALGIVAFFDHDTLRYESFNVGHFIETWSSSWHTSFSDSFAWGIWDPVFHSGVMYGYENFSWHSFNDVFLPGAICLFNGADVYESFEPW